MLAGVYECIAYTQIISLWFCIFLCIFPTDLPGKLCQDNLKLPALPLTPLLA